MAIDFDVKRGDPVCIGGLFAKQLNYEYIVGKVYHYDSDMGYWDKVRHIVRHPEQGFTMTVHEADILPVNKLTNEQAMRMLNLGEEF